MIRSLGLTKVTSRSSSRPCAWPLARPATSAVAVTNCTAIAGEDRLAFVRCTSPPKTTRRPLEAAVLPASGFMDIIRFPPLEASYRQSSLCREQHRTYRHYHPQVMSSGSNSATNGRACPQPARNPRRKRIRNPPLPDLVQPQRRTTRTHGRPANCHELTRSMPTASAARPRPMQKYWNPNAFIVPIG